MRYGTSGRQREGNYQVVGFLTVFFLYPGWLPSGTCLPGSREWSVTPSRLAFTDSYTPPWPPLASTRPRAAARTRLRVNPHPFLFFAEPAPHIMRIGEWLFLSFLGAGPDWRLIDHLLISRYFHGSPCHLTAIAQDSIQAPIRPFEADRRLNDIPQNPRSSHRFHHGRREAD